MISVIQENWKNIFGQKLRNSPYRLYRLMILTLMFVMVYERSLKKNLRISTILSYDFKIVLNIPRFSYMKTKRVWSDIRSEISSKVLIWHINLQGYLNPKWQISCRSLSLKVIKKIPKINSSSSTSSSRGIVCLNISWIL